MNDGRLIDEQAATMNSFREQERKALLTLLAAGLLLLVCVVVIGAEPGEAKREMLSKHETVAQFEGLDYRQCRGMTALCPDKCGQSGNFATFRIVRYLAYEKTGLYSDPRQQRFVFQVDDNLQHLKVSKEWKEIIDGLKKGDFIRLDWQQDYVTKNGSSGPERPIKKIEKITREQANALTASLDKPST